MFSFDSFMEKRSDTPVEVFVHPEYGEYKCYELTVDEIADTGHSPRMMYKVVFTNTGYTYFTWKSRCKKLTVTDKMSPSVCGVGFIGDGAYARIGHGRLYKLWYNILHKTRDDVPEKWYDFQCFCSEVEEMEGYDGWCDGDLALHFIDSEWKFVSKSVILSSNVSKRWSKEEGVMKVGDVFKSNKYGDVTVLEMLPRSKCLVMFSDSGNVKEVFKSAVRSGQLSDK